MVITQGKEIRRGSTLGGNGPTKNGGRNLIHLDGVNMRLGF